MDKISIHQFHKVDQFFRQQKIDPNDSKKIRNYFYRRGFSLIDPINKVTQPLLELAQQNLKTQFLKLIHKVDSNKDGATKLLFETYDGLKLEAVILRIASGRTSLCISCQCGCKFGCKFCATGTLGFTRNLTTDEILDQIVQVSRILKKEDRRLRNVVFMGMGEPLDNYQAVSTAINIMIDQNGFCFSPTSIMVSTCGIIPDLKRFSKQFPKVHLAISLHGATDSTRSAIMPINKKYSLSDLKTTIQEITAQTGQSIMLEYLLLKGINDSSHEKSALIEFCQGLNIKLNLIKYNNQGDTDYFHPVTQDQTIKFQEDLKKEGIKVTLRYSLGEDIDAACGQLALRTH
jgi:23S rRNA (adenine2503-C2)-methyltransferase